MGMEEDLPSARCPRCGTQGAPDLERCPRCGRPLDGSPERSDLIGLALVYLFYPLLALLVACAGLVLCLALLRGLGR